MVPKNDLGDAAQAGQLCAMNGSVAVGEAASITIVSIARGCLRGEIGHGADSILVLDCVSRLVPGDRCFVESFHGVLQEASLFWTCRRGPSGRLSVTAAATSTAHRHARATPGFSKARS